MADLDIDWVLRDLHAERTRRQEAEAQRDALRERLTAVERDLQHTDHCWQRAEAALARAREALRYLVGWIQCSHTEPCNHIRHLFDAAAPPSPTPKGKRNEGLPRAPRPEPRHRG